MRERAALDAVHGTSHAMLAVLQEEREVQRGIVVGRVEGAWQCARGCAGATSNFAIGAESDHTLSFGRRMELGLGS